MCVAFVVSLVVAHLQVKFEIKMSQTTWQFLITHSPREIRRILIVDEDLLMKWTSEFACGQS